MNWFLVLLVVCAGIYSSVSWFLPRLLAWLFKRKFHLRLQIGRVAIPKLILKDVNISKSGYSIHIDEISFRSSFFNSDVSKLLSVAVRDVRIDNNTEEKRSIVVENLLKPLLSKQGSDARGSDGPRSNADLNRLLDFRETKLPASLLMFAQFMAVHVYNVSVMVLRGDGSAGWLLHAKASELHVDGGAGGTSRALLVSAALVDASARLLPRSKHLCLAELACGLLLEGTLRASGPLSIEKVHATISNPTVSVHEALYSFMLEQRSGATSSPPPPPPPDPTRRDRMTDIIPRLSPVIPKIFSLKIDTTTLSGVRYCNVTDYQASLQSLQINSRFSAGAALAGGSGDGGGAEGEGVVPLPQVYVAFQMEQLKLTTSKEKLLFLNKLKLDAKLEKGVLNLYLIMSVLSMTYNHEHVYGWYSKHFQRKRSQPLQLSHEEKKQEAGAAVAPWVVRAFRSCVVQGCAELRGASLRARTRGDSALALGCGGFKIKLDQHRETRSGSYTSTLPRLLLGTRHWSAELLLDSGWLRAGPHSLDASEPPHKKQHVWGNTLFLGVALLKCGSHGALHSKIEAMMDCLRVEWSQIISDSILSALQCIQNYNPPKTSPKMYKDPVANGNTIAMNITLSHINIFSIIDEKTCLMTRIDAISLDKNTSKTATVISGLKVVDMIPYKDGCACQRAEEILITFFHLKLARIEYVPSSVENSFALLEVQFLENVDIEWSANLHLKIMAFVSAVRTFKDDARVVISRGSNGSVNPPKAERRLNWCATFKGESSLALILSAENNLGFDVEDLSISCDNVNGLSIVWNELKTTLNGADIIYVDGFEMERVLEDSEIRIERIANENFLLEWNQVWGITIDSMRVVFPYKHRFAESIQGEFVSLFKWLKIVHNIEKKPFTSDSPLPSDLQIKIEELILEMSDDPFEVKLRDNYELLEDEYKESQKRRDMLDAKVQELCKQHLFLPAGKVEELGAALRRKDAQIYVQRHRAAASPRTRLVACTLTRLHVLALADPVYHGTANAVRHIREIDFDSPWPEEGIEFTTLWCRAVSLRCAEWQLLLRDFPQPLLSMKELRLWGTFAGAEQVAPSRAYRTVVIDQGAPWGKRELERSMMPLKFYYDLCCEMTTFSYSFGPCWEPVIAQCNISFEQVSRPSLDPSLPLAWWDKVRLLMHGRLTTKFGRMTCLLHVSLDPYNTTEEMELTWSDLVLDWTNAKLVFRGDLNVFVRTASKYDDCRLLHLPGLKLAVKLGWQCAADPRDHHAVSPCAPDKLPEYSSNQEHDSFRAFRSSGLDLHISLETKPCDMFGPILLVYGSTLRWFESLKLILSGVTRPTRRGAVFHNVRPRRPQLSRHYRNVSTSLTLHNFQVYYWSSSSMQRGIELLGVRLTCGSEHALALLPPHDGLVRRARAAWSTLYMNCDLNDAEMWLKSAAPSTDSDATENAGSESSSVSLSTPVEKCYCLSVGRVSYGREAAAVARGAAAALGGGAPAPAHRLAVHDLRGAWTKINRDVAFALFDTYIKTKQLKKNLSTKALKEEDKPATSPKHQRDADMVSPPPTAGLQGAAAGGAECMLAQLLAEAGADPPVVFSDDLSGGEAASTAPDRAASHPPKHSLDDDSAHTTWLIELVNSQVLLKGCETRGYVILCAARAEVRQRVRRAPAATAWSGAFTCMQYYATVSAGDRHELDENIQWVSVEEIEERSSGHEISTLPDVPRLVGSGHSAGGVIGSTVGPSSDKSLTQLQRIVSRCACEFYYLSYDEETGGAGAGAAGGAGWGHTPEPYDAFTLMHHDLDVCTNSLQYAMLLDVVNNLVLYVEPERRRTLERRARMRFQLQLHKDEDPRKPIQKLQNQVRESLTRLRRLEKETYLKRRALADNDRPAAEELKNLDAQVNECKEQVSALGDELDAMVRAWREVAAATRRPPAPRLHSTHAPPHRLNEICFKSARWRLNDADGQLGIADLVLTNFLYTKTSRSDDSVEHQLELGYVRVTNLLPREPFPEVLAPQETSGRAPLARRAALRLFCRDRPPVGGISVKEHFEVNVVPIKIGLTKKFFNTMLKFCFPERDPDAIEPPDDDDDTVSLKSGAGSTLSSSTAKKAKKKPKDSNFYVKIEQKDDVEKMKERAEKNKLFIYIKIPEVPVRLSYKGSKEKNLLDVRDLPLVLPTMEYHNVTWTWLDLLLATKSDTRRVIVSQAIRQKLQLHRRAAAAPEPQEEDKARLLLGDRTVAESKPQKKSVPSVFKFSKS